MSPGFLVGLSLLLLNDIALKSLFAGWLTGKLSDFAGLFVFPLFWAALLPRFRRAVYILTALSFVFWKSSYSQPLIDAWNALALLTLGRTVDATDLLATAVLPLSFVYGEQQQRRPRKSRLRPAPYALAALSLFAFTATSYRTEIPYTDQKYHFQESPVELTRKVHHLEHLDPRYRTSCARGAAAPGDIELTMPADFCFDRVDATIGVGEEQGQAVVSLRKMEHHCPEGKNDKTQLRDIFEKQFIEKLKELSLAPPARESGAEPSPSATPQLRARGQLYFIQVGELTDVNAEELARHFRKKYGVSVRVLPKLPLTDEMRSPNFPNSRPVAERMIEAISNKYPRIVETPNDVIVGLVEDMNVQSDSKMYNVSYDLWGHFALVSLEALRPSTFCEPKQQEVFEARLRKAVARNIGMRYFRLPQSDNPRSVLYNNVGCVDELDYQGEDF